MARESAPGRLVGSSAADGIPCAGVWIIRPSAERVSTTPAAAVAPASNLRRLMALARSGSLLSLMRAEPIGGRHYDPWQRFAVHLDVLGNDLVAVQQVCGETIDVVVGQ